MSDFNICCSNAPHSSYVMCYALNCHGAFYFLIWFNKRNSKNLFLISNKHNDFVILFIIIQNGDRICCFQLEAVECQMPNSNIWTNFKMNGCFMRENVCKHPGKWYAIHSFSIFQSVIRFWRNGKYAMPQRTFSFFGLDSENFFIRQRFIFLLSKLTKLKWAFDVRKAQIVSL